MFLLHCHFKQLCASKRCADWKMRLSQMLMLLTCDTMIIHISCWSISGAFHQTFVILKLIQCSLLGSNFLLTPLFFIQCVNSIFFNALDADQNFWYSRFFTICWFAGHFEIRSFSSVYVRHRIVKKYRENPRFGQSYYSLFKVWYWFWKLFNWMLNIKLRHVNNCYSVVANTLYRQSVHIFFLLCGYPSEEI